MADPPVTRRPFCCIESVKLIPNWASGLGFVSKFVSFRVVDRKEKFGGDNEQGQEAC